MFRRAVSTIEGQLFSVKIQIDIGTSYCARRQELSRFRFLPSDQSARIRDHASGKLHSVAEVVPQG